MSDEFPHMKPNVPHPGICARKIQYMHSFLVILWENKKDKLRREFASNDWILLCGKTRRPSCGQNLHQIIGGLFPLETSADGCSTAMLSVDVINGMGFSR